MAKSTKKTVKRAIKRKAAPKAKAHGTRAESKQAKLIDMLKQRDGATIGEIALATPHRSWCDRRRP